MSSSSRETSLEAVELPEQLLLLADLVDAKPESFASGDLDIQAAALKATKYLFDRAVASEASVKDAINDLLKSIVPPEAPVTRSMSAKRQDQPNAAVPKSMFLETPLDMLVLKGMGDEQIWEQLELRTKNICAVLDSIVDRQPSDDEDGAAPNGSSAEQGDMELDESPDNLDFDDMNGDADSESDETSGNESEDMEEATVKLRDDDDKRPVWTGSRHPVLDDGFFSIDRFNRDTELMEAKSKSSGKLGKSESDSEEEEEEGDEIDYFAPLVGDEDDRSDQESEVNESEESEDDEADVGGLQNGSGMMSAMQLEEVEDITYDDFFRQPYRFNAEAGPSHSLTFPTGTLKRKASVRFAENVRVKKIKARGKGKSLSMGDDDDEDEDEVAFASALNGAGFVDPRIGTGPSGFGGFAPRKPVTVEQDEPEKDELGLGFEHDESDADGEVDDDDADMDDIEDDEDDEDNYEDEVDDPGRDTIERLKEDVFAEPADNDEPPPELSTHEKRLAALASEIAKLEDENVSDKPWLLMGEANAKKRPENSLLETDLEFEHAAKAAPILTEEVAKSLEDLIKRRILEGRFDDVVRQRPFEDKAFLPSRMIELQDTQSRKSLAQIYEDDYKAATSGEKRVDDRDGKLLAEHEEIGKSWDDISYRLDALCNAHFTPKQPKATITTISNVSSTTIESALPTATSAATMLAPEELFSFDARATKSKDEMTPAEKKSLRSKLKDGRRKQGQVLRSAVVKFASTNPTATAAAGFTKQPKSVNEAKNMALESLVKTGKGVTVVGKARVGKDPTPNAKAKKDTGAAGSFKL